MQELSDGWGQDAYPEARMTIIWKMVRNISRGQFLNAIEQLQSDLRFAPTPAQIKAACLPAIQQAGKALKEQAIAAARANRACSTCQSTGIVSAFHKGESWAHPYAFRCNECQMPDVLCLSYSIPMWDRDLEEQFDREWIKRQTEEAKTVKVVNLNAVRERKQQVSAILAGCDFTDSRQEQFTDADLEGVFES
jgi:hypothetical protein